MPGLDVIPSRELPHCLPPLDDAAMTDTTTVIDQFNAAFRERAPEKLAALIR